MRQIKLTKPDDWHLHLRQGEAMSSVVDMSAKQMGRAIVMPNLSPPVKTVNQALDYRREIIAARSQSSTFDPLMTLYLTDTTSKQEIIDASNEEHVYDLLLRSCIS